MSDPIPEGRLQQLISEAFYALVNALEHEGDTAGYSDLPEDTAVPILRAVERTQE